MEGDGSILRRRKVLVAREGSLEFEFGMAQKSWLRDITKSSVLFFLFPKIHIWLIKVVYLL